jgi:hypothetical protein
VDQQQARLISHAFRSILSEEQDNLDHQEHPEDQELKEQQALPVHQEFQLLMLVLPTHTLPLLGKQLFP